MADVRLAIQVDASGAVRSVKTFNDELGETPKKAKEAGGALGDMKKLFSSVAGIDDFRSALIGAAGGFTAFAVASKAMDVVSATVHNVTVAVSEGFRSMLNYSDQIVTLSQRTGLSVNALQSLSAVAKTSGTDIGSVSAAVVKMEVALQKGDAAFGKMGLSITKLKAMAPDDAFAKVATAVSSIDDPMQRAAAAVAIFGRSGAEMLPLLTSDIEATKKQAEALGLVMREDMVAAAEAFGDKLDLTKDSAEKFLERIGGVIAASPAFSAALDQVGLLFGRMSKAIDDNRQAIDRWLSIGLLAAVKGLDVFVAGLQGAIDHAYLFAGTLGGAALQFVAEKTGLRGLVDEMRAYTEETMKAIIARTRWAAIDMGGKGVLKPGFVLPTQGVVGANSFDATNIKPKEIKVDVLKIPNLPGMWTDLFGTGSDAKFGTLQGGSKTFNLWGDRTKFLPTEINGNIHVDASMKAAAKSTFSASQALQNLANIAALSGSKLAKGLAGIFGGASGVSAGLSSLKSMSGSGITGLLGKAGAIGSIAASVIGIGSSLFGLFKKKPKEPAPEPPKVASAESWRSFVGDQQSKGAAGVLSGVSGIKITSEADMMAQASIASQTFWATFKTQGLMKAAEMFRGVRDKMLETFKSFGASDETIAALLGPMSQVVDLAGNDAFKGAADGANGFAEALASIVNQQLPMSIEQFRAFESQAVSGYEQMKQAALDQGLSMEDAIKTAAQGSAQYLQTLQDAATRYGFNLDSSKAVFDAASASGLSLGMDSQDRLILSLDKLTETLGGTPPKFEAALTAGANAAGSRMSDAAFATGGGRGDASAIGDAVGQKVGLAIETLRGELRSQPITVNFPPIQMDGQAVAAGLAVVVDRGGYGGSRLTTAISESL